MSISRKLYSFPGGIHLPENKLQSLGLPIQSVPLPDKLILPLQQHIGAVAKAIVKAGDLVKKGQCLAQPQGFVSASFHAPTSGTIVEIAEHEIPHVSGLSGLCIVLQPDGEESWCELQPIADFNAAAPAELVEKIRQSGITGMGGAGFPTSVKLSPPANAKIETLIINAVECEPYITADDMLMREQAAGVIEGVLILTHILKNREAIIAIEDNKPNAITAMQHALTGLSEPHCIEIAIIPTRYPSGGEKQLIQNLTGKEVPSGKPPLHVGIVVQNTATTYAIHRAISHGEPLISRIVTLTGEALNKPGNYEALLGTPIEHLLQLAEIDNKKLSRLIMGGPMMGFALDSTELPIVKTTNCLLAANSAEYPEPTPANACIRCGACAEVCPASLLPQQLFWFSMGGELDKAEQYNLADCIECGACSYVCPSRIPLVQYYRATKGELAQRSADLKQSDHARDRFEFRESRLAREKAEKDAKRKARAAASAKAQAAKKAAAALAEKEGGAPATGGETDMVAAALARVEAKKAEAKKTEQKQDVESTTEQKEAVTESVEAPSKPQDPS
ncbi:MAG: electron transport complex subunit RsxC [Pseudomonadales bacterium]|nr:electron transport complex subunit RsxC [Pseudomonadales bacterium]